MTGPPPADAGGTGRPDGPASPEPWRRWGRDIGTGIAVAGGALYLTFFGTRGATEVATLAVGVATLIWFSTVDPRRLADERGRPHLLLFGLAAIGVALTTVAAVVLQTGTLFLLGTVVAAATLIGIVRAIRFGFLAGGDA